MMEDNKLFTVVEGPKKEWPRQLEKEDYGWFLCSREGHHDVLVYKKAGTLECVIWHGGLLADDRGHRKAAWSSPVVPVALTLKPLA